MNKRIVCFDYGRKRIGYAVSDILHITVSPKKVFMNEDSLFEEIQKQFLEDDPELIIIGMPNQNEKNESLVKEINDFAKEITNISGIDHLFIDESYSSKQAVERMIQGGKKKKFRREKSHTDMYAAAIILEEYLIQQS